MAANKGHKSMLDIMDASLYNTIYYSWVHEAQAVRRPARTHNIYMQWDKEPPPPEDAANSLLGFRTTHTALCSVFRVHAVLPATLRRPACQRATISVRRIFFILYFLPPFFLSTCIMALMQTLSVSLQHCLVHVFFFSSQVQRSNNPQTSCF